MKTGPIREKGAIYGGREKDKVREEKEMRRRVTSSVHSVQFERSRRVKFVKREPIVASHASEIDGYDDSLASSTSSFQKK